MSRALVERIELLESRGGSARQLLRDYFTSPSYPSSEELQDEGWEILKVGARNYPQNYSSRRDLVRMLKLEKDRLTRANISFDEDGLKKYLRLNRKGSPYPLSGRMRMGVFMVLTAENMIR